MKKIYSIIALALAFASCSSLMEKDVTPAGQNAVRFTTNIGAFATKATADAFENGDQVGIIANEPINVDNVLYTVSGNTLTSNTPICWLEGQEAETRFFAYYPYDKEFSMLNEYQYVLKVEKDQRTHEAYTRSDFLVGEGAAKPGEPVNLEFQHFFSRIDVTLPSQILSSVASVGISEVSTSYVIGTGEQSEPETVTAAQITSASGEKTFSAIIIPQMANPSLVITKTDGSVQTFSLGKTMYFEQGKRYQAQLSLKDDGSLEAEFVFRIFDWLSGDWVWFEGYKPRWSVIGNFTNDWNDDYEMEDLGGGKYQIDLWLPEEAEFKFRLDGSWDTNLGCSTQDEDGYFRKMVELGETLELIQGGTNLYYPQGGRVKIELNVNEKTAVVKEYKEFQLEYNLGDQWSSRRLSDISDGLFTIKEFYISAGMQLAILDQNWIRYCAPEADITTETVTAKTLTVGVPIKLVENGVMLYSDRTFFADIVFDSNDYTLTITESENQAVSIDKFFELQDGSEVAMSGLTVYAVAEEGFVVSTDGYRGLFIFSGYGNPLPSVGDVVDVTGKKKMYANQPELAEASFVKTGTAELAKVYYQNFEGYNYGYSVPVEFEGELYPVPYTSHESIYVVTDNGILRGHYCFDEYLKYYGSKVKVKGWYGGDNGLYHYFTLVSIEGLEEGYHGTGTLEDPYDAVGAMLYARSLQPGSTSDGDVFIKGLVRDVVMPYSIGSDYPGYGSFLVAESVNFYDCYFNVLQASFLENKLWVDGNSVLKPGDEVIVSGKVILADDGKSAGTAPGAAYLYSLNGATSEVPQEHTFVGAGTIDNPYSVADAIYIAEKTGETATAESYYIRGRVSEVREQFGSKYGNATFSIVDENGDGRSFLAYRTYYFYGEHWTDGQYTLNYWDDVVVYGHIVNYKGNTPETAQGAALYSLNGITEPYVPVGPETWSVIGTIQGHNWDYDIPMYQCYESGGLYALIYYRQGDEFKLRRNADWAVNRGADTGGNAGGYNAVQDGANITLPGEGIYEIFYYPDDEYIYIAEYGQNETWGITGSLEGLAWADDHMSKMAIVNDILNPVIVFNDVVYNAGEEFKIRFQHQWFFEYGGYSDTLVPGSYYPLQPAGANLTINGSGMYNVYFDLYNQTVMVEKTGGEEPQIPAITIPEITELVKGGTSASNAVIYDGIIDNTLVTYTNGSYAYLQDNSGSIVLYQKNHGLNTGDILNGHIYGSGYLFNGLPEITSLGDQYTIVGNVGAVNPDVVTLESLFDYYDFYMSRLVRIENVTVTASAGKNATIIQDGKEITVYAQSASIVLPAVNSIGNITAIVSIYKGAYQLAFWEEGWFEKTGEVQTENPDPGTGTETDDPNVTSVTFDNAQLAAAACGGENNAMNEIIWFTNSTDYGTTAVTELRIYKGKKLTVSAADGYVITGIEITCTASGVNKQGPGCWGAGAPEGYSYSDYTGTWAGSQSSVSFTAIDNQVRIKSLKVTYEKE